MSLDEQLQFAFMREVNMRSYIIHERNQLLTLYSNLIHTDSELHKPPLWAWEAFITSGEATKFREKWHNHYFGDDANIRY